MSIRGLNISVTFARSIPFTDEWIDVVYSSLESNMAIKSVDMFMESETEVSFLLGIDDFLDSGEEFVTNIANDSLDSAFAQAAGPREEGDRTLDTSVSFAFA